MSGFFGRWLELRRWHSADEREARRKRRKEFLQAMSEREGWATYRGDVLAKIAKVYLLPPELLVPSLDHKAQCDVEGRKPWADFH